LFLEQAKPKRNNYAQANQSSVNKMEEKRTSHWLNSWGLFKIGFQLIV
jgi:hypothetical protein